ncbi:receptor-type tyrosine-protein phosphatase alpha-like [Physella acuta]|uniref:receptor-type tyrosine-protein phosphatase alpha-like n=1 Tax=Physella acuta TaxID=109671 RepID=UPI0027DE9492|nr:receptor-type tyrosine-protein phosphatase alpha-like [Physella acuta]
MCPNYTYGDSCSKTCSKHCDDDGTCDVTNGTCVYGCRSGFQGETCDLEYTQDKSGDTPPIAAIVAPIVAVILIALITIAGFVFWRKRRLNKNQKSNGGDLAGNELSTLAEYSGDESSRHNGKYKEKPTVVVNAYKNDDVDLDKRYINVTTLNDFMESQTRHYFVEEFKKIPAPSNVTTNVGQNESNKHKNRYKNICTYDHSRVHLEVNASKNEGDYINASYVEGYNNEEKFIASQGPNEVITNDFVRMLWEQKVDKVVMLTNLIEEGKEKCVRYWPLEGTVTFGDIKVKLAATHVFAEYTIRKLELRKKNEVGHHFTQFHFTSWPDKGVPLTPWGLVDFEQRVALGSTSRPIVVHCSAGVGRTGTFIALRNVMREAEETGRINCFKTVAKLRQDRVLMVQTAEQYEFLHKAAQVAIVCMRTTVSSNDILTRLKYLEEMTISKISNMEKEFQTVSRLSEEFNKNESNKTSKDAESNVYQNNNTSTKDDKNRSSLVIPSKLYGAVLSCESNSFNHYINAVLVPSFTSRENQILTQFPMPNTVTDFWRLVAQYNVKLVVAFQTKSDDQDETIGEYLPQSTTTPLDCGPYEIHTGPVKSESLWEEQNITVKANIKAMDFQPLNVTSETQVTHIASKSTDLNPKNLLKLLKHTRSNNVQAQGRVLYMCRNGAEYSGLACVLSLLLDRMDHDQSLTVPLVVGAIKCIRPQVIPSLDQYRCLYQVLQRYSELNTPYSNYETPLIPTHQNIWTQQEKSVAENVYENS